MKAPDITSDQASRFWGQWNPKERLGDLLFWSGDPDHPVIDALKAAYLMREIRFEDSVARKDEKAACNLIDEIFELRRWLLPLFSFSDDDISTAADQMIEVYRSMGVPFSSLKVFDKLFRKKPKGRPAHKRAIFIRAFEVKLLAPTVSWRELTDQFCDCDHPPHSEYCFQAIRSGVLAFKAVFNKYHILPDFLQAKVNPHKPI